MRIAPQFWAVYFLVYSPLLLRTESMQGGMLVARQALVYGDVYTFPTHPKHAKWIDLMPWHFMAVLSANLFHIVPHKFKTEDGSYISENVSCTCSSYKQFVYLETLFPLFIFMQITLP